MLNNSKAIPQGNGGLPCNRCTHKSQTLIRFVPRIWSCIIFQDGGFPAFCQFLFMLYNFVANKIDGDIAPEGRRETLNMY